MQHADLRSLNIPVDECLKTTLKAQRAMRELTQAELAGMAGVTRKSINAIEMGHMVPSTILALKLARALCVPVETLFRIEGSP
jgi:putative transcriptional regulator